MESVDEASEAIVESASEAIVESASEAVANEAACEVLADRVGVLAAQIHALSAELVDVVAELESLGGSQDYPSMAQWLSVRGGFSSGDARRLALLASRRDDLPTLMDHARVGRVSTGVLAGAARVVTAETESRIAEIAITCTPAQTARVLSTFRALADPPDPDGPDDPSPPETWWRAWFDEAGRGRIDAALSPDAAALVQQAWDAARAAGEADRPATPAADPDTTAEDVVRLGADEIASRWATTMLDHAHDEGICRPGGDRHGVLVNIDVGTLARVLGLQLDPAIPIGLGTQAFDARTGAHLADHDVARFLCDADIQVVVHHHGVPLWMSNTTRTANRHQRRALRFRASGTGGCEYPGCTQTRYLDAHHVTFHRHGGPTELSNLLLLCSHHHRALHRGEFTISTDGAQTFTFTHRNGSHLGTSSTSQRSGGPPPELQRLPHIDRPPDPPPGIGPDTPRSIGGGEPLTSYGLDVYLEHLLAA